MQHLDRAVPGVQVLDAQRSQGSGRHAAFTHAVPEVGLDHQRVVAHLVRRAFGDLAAELHRHDLVGDAHHHRHVVLDEQHGELELVADRADGLAQLVDLAVGQPGRRLVEQQEASAWRPAPGRSRAASACRTGAPPPGGRRAGRGRAGRAARRQPRAIRRFSRPAPMREIARTNPTAALAVRADHHVLEQRHRGEQGEVLERAGDAEPGRSACGARASRSTPSNSTRPDGRVVDATDDVEHRRLARAVGPDQPADLTLVDGEAQLVEGDDPTEPHRHFTHVEQRHADRASPFVRFVTKRTIVPNVAGAKRSSPCECAEATLHVRRHR